MLKDDERAIRKFYSTLTRNGRIDANALFHSKVYYARWALWERTGVMYSLEHVSIALWLEGHLPLDEIKEIPEWYWEQYLRHLPERNFGILREHVQKLKARRFEEKLNQGT